MRARLLLFALPLLALALAGPAPTPAQTKGKTKSKQVIPHGQSKPPNDPLTPAEAIKRMQVPPGFSVELVACEPDLVNPVAMTFDERGRIWVTESLEYPRRSAGVGKDRVKVLEDTDADGKVDKVTVVIEGLNIPSGIAVGHGGVWVANSPDILFYPYLDAAKLKLGKPWVVVTGFGRDDTHELPNSLTWGPDGWLYGLNGVFNQSHVKQNGKEWRFTCALFRIHPRTKEFQVFCEGTSNPWGIAFDKEGSAFVSACVIDHLWHLVETGYYHRQGGPYPPYTWKIESIVKHKHQKAAYCGIHWFDSDAYPPEYREKLYMGNIHGNCINSDELTRDGSTYFGKPRPDFLTANDAWFMPVVQKTGPDGCLYVLDWYDRYHCYQDANRDPAGIDRLKGRLYRVRYKDTPRAKAFDLTKETDEQLIERLHSPNVFYRDLAQRVLLERLTNAKAIGRRPVSEGELKGIYVQLDNIIADHKLPLRLRMPALWVELASGRLGKDLFAHPEPAYRAWAVRTVGNQGAQAPDAHRDIVAGLAKDLSPDVRLQVAIAAHKLTGLDPVPLLVEIAATCGDDKLIPHIVWQNLHPLLDEHGAEFFRLAAKHDVKAAPGLAAILPRALDRTLASKKLDGDSLAGIVVALAESGDRRIGEQALTLLAQKIQTGELAGARLSALRSKLTPILGKLAAGGNLDAAFLAASLKDPAGIETARKLFAETKQPESVRLKALTALVAADDPSVLQGVPALLASKTSPQFRGQVLAALGKLDEPKVAVIVLGQYPKMEPELQPRAIDLLTERPAWSKRLLGEIAAKKIAPSALNVNQVRKLLASRDKELVKQVTSVWGTLREDRNPEREKVVGEVRGRLRRTPGDPMRGVAVFKKICAQCHKMYGEGVDVGPDITANGRSDFEQLLSNVFDPSLVIGAGYHGTTVVTDAGQVINGLVVENSPQRVVLKVQGGEIKTIPRDSIEQITTGKVSMMPEGLERQMQPQEIADLFAYITLDRPPTDPAARRIPGAPAPKR
jgi:putative membrane-bound dehydrogenase-like protein